MTKTLTLEMGGIPPKDFIKYFIDAGGKTDDQMTFNGSCWQVVVENETWSKVGSLTINHVLLHFTIDENEYTAFMKNFYMQFMKAGG